MIKECKKFDDLLIMLTIFKKVYKARKRRTRPYNVQDAGWRWRKRKWRCGDPMLS